MHSTFIGREQQLEEVDRLIKAKQGGVYAVKGKPGIGKSTLLRHIAEQYNGKSQVFVDLNDLPPLQTAVEFLQFFAERAHRLKHTQEALAKVNGTYKTVADLTKPYQTVLTDAGQLAADELSKNLDDQDKSRLSGIASILWKLGVVLWGRKQESDKTKLGDPELYLLKALKQDCKQQPLIFIDTYERLQAASEISQQKIRSRYSRPHEHLDPKNASISLQDWLERFLPFLQQQGAIIIIAGRKTGYWQAHSLEHFEDKDILALAGSSQHADLKQAVAEHPQAVLGVLNQLSFGGIPLWLQLAINFIILALSEGNTIKELAEKKNLNDYFDDPKRTGDDLDSANIEHASCKLALFKRVMQHNLEIADRAWQMALPLHLDKAVLQVIFEEQAEIMHEAFVKSGLLPKKRLLDEDQAFSLHNEVRDLLLAYARYQKWPETEESKTLHKKLADFFAQRYQRQPQIQWLIEQSYHQVMSGDDANLEPINEPQLLLTMAEVFIAEKRYTEVSQLMLRLIDLLPDHENAWVLLGGVLYDQGKLDEAVAACQKQIAINPEHKYAWYILGIALGNQGKLDEAIAAHRKQIEIKPDHENAWYYLGKALGNQGKLDEAIAAYRKQTEVKPDHENAWLFLGIALGNQGKLDEAIDAYRKQTEVKPDHENAWLFLGIALGNQGKLDEEVAVYRKQTEVKPDHENAWNILGTALSQQGKLDEAVTAFQKQIQIKPDHEFAWLGLGIVLSQQHKLDEAVYAYRLHTLIKPVHESVWFRLGIDLSLQGELDEAIAAHRKQIEIKPDHENAWCCLGIALGQQGKLNEAVAAYRKQTEVKPDHENAWLFLGLALSEQGKLEDAVAAYRKQTEVKPDHENAWYYLGIALGQQGKFDEAVAAYRKQTEVKPDHENAWLGLGISLSDQGKLDEAQSAYAQALQLNPKNLSALSNDVELALVQQDTKRCHERIQKALVLADNKTQEYAILPFLSWLAGPEGSHRPVLDAIHNLDAAVKIAWNFLDTRLAIGRLNPEQQQIAGKFIAYFEGKSQDLPDL